MKTISLGIILVLIMLFINQPWLNAWQLPIIGFSIGLIVIGVVQKVLD